MNLHLVLAYQVMCCGCIALGIAYAWASKASHPNSWHRHSRRDRALTPPTRPRAHRIADAVRRGRAAKPGRRQAQEPLPKQPSRLPAQSTTWTGNQVGASDSSPPGVFAGPHLVMHHRHYPFK